MNSDKNFDFNNYLLNHAEELKRFSKDVNLLSSSALTQLQRLPVSLRRRAASHNIKRLPHRFHKKAKIIARIKNKCRKYRRRHLNLKEIYMKRQMINKWLLTHIWHAKRFKMITRWGWRIPLQPTQKCFRPSMKAMKDGCCIVDMSFFCTLEICGDLDKIVHSLTRLIQPQGSDVLINRIREGREISCVAYEPDQSPHRPICPVKIVQICVDQFGSSVLVSFHCAATEEMVAALRRVLSVDEINESIWVGDDGLLMRDRSSDFVRFRLIGHKSQQIISTLIDEINPYAFLSDVPLVNVPVGYAFETIVENMQARRPLLKQIDIPSKSSKKRVSFPSRKLGRSAFQTCQEFIDKIVEDLDVLRKSMKNTQYDMEPVNSNDPFPIFLTRHHYLDSKAPGGWDILLLAKWAMPVWVTLITKGCRAIGWRYWTRFCALEATSLTSKNDCYPSIGWPDAIQGVKDAEKKRELQTDQWNRRPPSKRVNYTACATTNPFHCPWISLLPDDALPSSQFVLRNPLVLTRVVAAIFDGSIKPTLDQLVEFDPHIRSALVPVVLDCSASIAHDNATIMAARIDDVLARSTELLQDLQPASAVRVPIGYVQCADQSLLVGRGRGFGFVSLWQLVALGASIQPVARGVWLRNGNSRRLVPATLTVAF